MLTIEEKQELVSKPCMLDGKPAKISGIKNQFATVSCLDTGASFEWSWENVQFIMEDRGGLFRS